MKGKQNKRFSKKENKDRNLSVFSNTNNESFTNKKSKQVQKICCVSKSNSCRGQ